jgi:hypothetical protein
MNFYPNIIHWPRNLNRDRMWSWELMARTISGGRSLSGLMPQARVDGGGMWSATLQDVRVTRPDDVRTWRALAARLDAGATPFCMEMREPRLAPWPIVDGVPVTAQYESENSDGSTCSDGTGYVSDVISAAVMAAAALRATALQIIIENAAALRGGEHFSIQHDTFSHRLYRVGKVTGGDGRAHTVQQVTFTGSPAVISATGHGLVTGQAVFFRTGGALPPNLAADTIYYAAPIGDDTFAVAATPGGTTGSPQVLIDVSGADSGTHRVVTGGIPTVTIRPPLREATAAGARVEFDHPKCIMRLAKPDAMDLPLELRFFGRATIPMIEDFPPFDLVDGDAEE